MKTLTCSAQYRPYLESMLALALREIHRDEQRRAHGGEPVIPDTLLEPRAEGNLVALVNDLPSAEQQARDLEWPREPVEARLKRRSA